MERLAGVSAPAKRDRRYARAFDQEIAPLWHDRFARMLLRDLPKSTPQLVLDVHAGSGRTTTALLARLHEGSRILALEPDPALVALARARVRPQWKQRVYFKEGDIARLTDMRDRTYDLTIANGVLGEVLDWSAVMAQLVRMTKPGGQVRATLPLFGTWGEAEDLLAEALADLGLVEAASKLAQLRRLRPTGPELAEGLSRLGVGEEHFVIQQERFDILFGGGREFLFSPLVGYGPLPLWKAIVAADGTPQEVFWRLKEVIDTYFAERVFSVTVVTGLVTVEVEPIDRATTIARRYWERYPSLHGVFGGHDTLDEADLDIDIEIDDEDEDEDEDEALSAAESDAAPQTAERKPSAREPDLDTLLHEVLDLWEEDLAPSKAADATWNQFGAEPLTQAELEAIDVVRDPAAASPSRPLPPLPRPQRAPSRSEEKEEGES